MIGGNEITAGQHIITVMAAVSRQVSSYIQSNLSEQTMQANENSALLTQVNCNGMALFNV